MMNRHDFTRRTIFAFLMSSLPFAAHAQNSLLNKGKGFLSGVKGGSASGLSLSDGEIGGGLKDALKVATQRVVGQLGKSDGYFNDAAIRIPLPGVIQKIQGPLKSIGAAGMLDDLQLKMNRAAEQAAPKALDIFTDAVSKMSITDARGILTGPEDSATKYFRGATSDNLTRAFLPVVSQSLSSAGAATVFQSVQSRAAGLPLVGADVSKFNLADFTVGKALDGLFLYLGKEEAAIRTNPAARTTDVLKKVFG